MNTTQTGAVLRHIRHLAAAGQADAQLLGRFVRGREQAAFEALVRRHGPLVLGVCRRVLHNLDDAEDAFQATFLALARQAGSIGQREALAGWLYRVAYRVATRERDRARTRQRYERQAVATPAGDALAEVTGRELLAVLDEELQRLPERQRVPLVLCYLQGKTRDEAARQLGWSLSTLQRRLEQGRERLRQRLSRRGLALPAALAAAGLAQGTATAVPAPLVAATLQGVAGTVTGPASALVAGALQGMAAGRKAVAALLLAVALLGSGTGVLLYRTGAGGPAAPAEAVEPRPPDPAAGAGKKLTAKDEKQATLSGRVLDPDGKPVPGARVAVLTVPEDAWRTKSEEDIRSDVLGRATADAEGRFRLRVRRVAPQPAAPLLPGQMIAAARGYGFGLHGLDLDADRADVVIRLRPERPLRGRVIDLQGAPVPPVRGLKAPVFVVMEKREPKPVGIVRPVSLPLWPAPVVTDDQGRFEVRGAGRGQRVILLVRDGRFEPGQIELGAGDKDPPAEVTTVLSPARPVEGRITYADTGKPVAGAEVRVHDTRTRTDRDGRFRLNPNVNPWSDYLVVYAPAGGPYMGLFKHLDRPKGGARRRMDLTLPRGILVRGKITEAGSGRPVAGGSVYYIPRGNNPNIPKDVAMGSAFIVPSEADGTFRIVVPAGVGHLLVEGPAADYVPVEVSDNQLREGKPGGQRTYAHAVVPLDLAPKGEPPAIEVRLRRGVTVKGKVVGPEGQPVDKVLVFCRLNTCAPMTIKYEPRGMDAPGGAFTFNGCDPDRAYPAIFLDEKNGWGAVAEISAGQSGGKPLTIRLARCGSVVARFVDADRIPLDGYRPRVEMVLTPGPHRYALDPTKGALAADSVPLGNAYQQYYRRTPQRTNARGLYTFPALVPGATYRLLWEEKGDLKHRDFVVKPGGTLDLGDVVVSRGNGS
jgi:RNA polymerase sigma factor (sigma-70 family)